MEMTIIRHGQITFNNYFYIIKISQSFPDITTTFYDIDSRIKDWASLGYKLCSKKVIAGLLQMTDGFLWIAQKAYSHFHMTGKLIQEQ